MDRAVEPSGYIREWELLEYLSTDNVVDEVYL
jgi:hypothetical protein